jgi:hypothetical protein
MAERDWNSAALLRHSEILAIAFARTVASHHIPIGQQ